MEGGRVCLARSELLALLTWEVRDFQRLSGTQSHLSILGDGALLDSKGNFAPCNERILFISRDLIKGGGATPKQRRGGAATYALKTYFPEPAGPGAKHLGLK